MNTLVMTDIEGQPLEKSKTQTVQRRRLCTFFESILQLIVRIRDRSSTEQTAPSFEVASPMFAATSSASNDDELFKNADNLRRRVLTLFDRARREAIDAGYKDILVDDAGLAMAAFLDEAVNLSNWDQKGEWQSRPIAKELFRITTASGNEFYDRLDRIKGGRTDEVMDVLEVYYLCLAIGFKGKYILASENLGPITRELHRKLDSSQDYRKTQLSIDKSGGINTFGVIKSKTSPWYAYGTALIIIALVWLAARSFAS